MSLGDRINRARQARQASRSARSAAAWSQAEAGLEAKRDAFDVVRAQAIDAARSDSHENAQVAAVGADAGWTHPKPALVVTASRVCLVGHEHGTVDLRVQPLPRNRSK